MLYENQDEPGRVELKRRARKRRILDAALALCTEHGLAGMTVQKLAAELDYTAGALYRYFPSKDALIAELERRALEDIAERFAAARAQQQGDAAIAAAAPRERALFELLAIAHFYVDLLDALPQQLRLITLLLGDQRDFVGDADVARVAPVFISLLDGVAKSFRAAGDTGALATGDATHRTVVYWSSLQGVTQMQKMVRFGAELFDPRFRAPELARALLCGWGADAAELDRAATLVSSWRKSCSELLQ